MLKNQLTQLFVLLFAIYTFGQSCPSPGSIIITEIMKDPNAVSDANGEYFEVYNTTLNPIDMSGWVISDLGSNSFVVSSSVIVAPDSYVVFARNSNTATNGGFAANFDYSGMVLGNTDDEIILKCSNGVEIDRVAYDNGINFPNPTGASMELRITAYHFIDNDNGANWDVAVTPFGDGDFGTPGRVNSTLSTNNINIEKRLAMYPNPTTANQVTIESPNQSTMDITVYDILGKPILNKVVTNNHLDISSLTSGIYLISIKQGSASTTRKLIVK